MTESLEARRQRLLEEWIGPAPEFKDPLITVQEAVDFLGVDIEEFSDLIDKYGLTTYHDRNDNITHFMRLQIHCTKMEREAEKLGITLPKFDM